MSTNLNYKQVANVTRRTWDKETFERKAQDRLRAEEEQSTGRNSSNAASSTHALSAAASLPDEFVPAPKDAVKPEGSERAYLKARSSHADIDSKVGTAEMISVPAATATATTAISKDNGVTKTGVGWHCRVCDCFLKDSHTYLDHINGRKHQRKLGYSMHVERSTKDQLQETLAKLAEQQKKASISHTEELVSLQNYEEIVKSKDEQAQKLKQEREQRRKEKKERLRLEEEKRLQQDQEDNNGDEEEEEEEEPAMDPAMAAMMGFTGFGGGNKN
jgi:U4/U6.U5 tri-snRNP component SNU23